MSKHTVTISQQHFPVILEMDEDGFYIVTCPSFRGCHSYGKTIVEAMNNIKGAIELCVACAEEEDFLLQNQFIGFREVALSIK